MNKKESKMPAGHSSSSLHVLADQEIQRFLQEDCPYGDLTTSLLGIGAQPGRIAFSTRHDTVVCCAEEAARLFEGLGCTIDEFASSGTMLAAGRRILAAHGRAGDLHAGWKAALNLLEAASGIATRMRALVEAAQSVDPDVEVVATRKVFPGTKPVAVKAVYAGGGTPHRLGLSESVLVFAQHTVFLDDSQDLWDRIPLLRRKAPEKKIAVEVTTYDMALDAARAGADVIQVDKMDPEALSALVPLVRGLAPGVIIAAAGGVNEENAREYAATGVDLLVTSAMYWGKPADIAVSMEPLGQGAP